MIKKEQRIELDQGCLNPVLEGCNPTRFSILQADKLPPWVPLPLVEAFSTWDRAQNWDEELGVDTPERHKELCFAVYL